MPGIVHFKLTNQLTRNTGQSVLVYRMPAADRLSADLFLSAWQILNPSANGGSQRFRLADQLQLAVEHEESLCRSPLVDVRPNQLYLATNSDNQGPALQLSGSETPPSAKQVAVRNDTDPAIRLSVIWFIDGRPIAIQKGLNLGGTTTFELTPTLYFLPAIPSNKGLNQLSEELSYVVPMESVQTAVSSQRFRVPAGVPNVSIRWLRPGGLSGADVLLFDPPSAPPTTP